jgi:hypothetical protein
MTSETETLAIDAYVVSRSEKHAYNIEEKDRPLILDIRGVYLFDASKNTHCCELTPSYLLYHLYDEVILTDDACEYLTDEQKISIYEKYEHLESDDVYLHCKDVSTAIKTKTMQSHHYGDTNIRLEDTTYDEQIKSLCEHFCGNHPF